MRNKIGSEEKIEEHGVGDRTEAPSLKSVFCQLCNPIIWAFTLKMFCMDFLIGSTMLNMAFLFRTISSSSNSDKSFNLSAPGVPFL